MQNVLQQAPICLHGDGTPYRSYLYAADLMIWLWTLLCHGQSGRAYNVGSEQAINLEDLANLMARQVDPQVPVVIATQPNPKQLPTRYIPSTQRAQQELGLRQKIDLVDGIQRTLNWLKLCTNKN
jgi:dTDP-glucose 4,6-dehydratase